MELQPCRKHCARRSPPPAKQHHARDLRSTLDWLRAQGDLIETDKAVDPDLEVTGLQKHMDGGCPVLFNNVKGKPNHRVVTNLFGDMKVINKMFGWKDDAERVQKLAYALSHPLKPVEIPQDAGAVPGARDQESEGRERARGADPAHHLRARADRRLRHPLRHRAGIRWRLRPRLQPHEFPLGQCRHVPDLARLAHVAGGQQVLQVEEPVPITMCFGVPPACTLLAGAGFDYAVLPMGCDEIGIAGAVQGTPIRLVKARTVDAMALADSELVLEGYVNPRDRRFETKESEDAGVQGRFHFHPEWAGYMGKAYKAPTFHVTGITMRKPKTQADHLRARRAHARRPQHRHHGARGGDLRAVQPAAARHRAERGDPLLHDRLGRLHHPGQEAPPARRGLAAQLHGRGAVLLAGHAARDRGERGRRSLFDGRRHVVPHHARESEDRHPQSDPGRARPDLHAGRAHDRGREAVDRVEHAISRAAWASMPRCRSATRATSCGRSIRSTGSSRRTSSRKKDIENARSRMVGWVHSLARTGR